IISTDSHLHLWHYDRESSIQSSGINIIEQLPYFVALIMLFQRFSNPMWGHSDRLTKSGPVTTIKIDQATYTSREDSKSRYTLHGRGTVMLHLCPSGESKYTAIIKTSFPSENRLSEIEAIRKCIQLAAGDIMILDHIPKVIRSEDFPDFSTSKIRRILGIFREGRSRIPRAVIFELRVPITQLEGKELWVAFWDLIRCHFLLWRLGLYHGDISVSNLMYDMSTKKGILNDWDLSTTADAASPNFVGRDRTASMPFMALDLLSERGWKGEIKRLYRHDLESFIWVLLWICVRFENGDERRPAPLEDFITAQPINCQANKLNRIVGKLTPASDFMFCWLSVVRMVNYWQTLENARRTYQEERDVILSLRARGAHDLIGADGRLIGGDNVEEVLEEEDAQYLQKMLLLTQGAGMPVNLNISL
ncbi:hypothetical protein C8J56DRAFT_778892, partial [Mycena floridula]